MYPHKEVEVPVEEVEHWALEGGNRGVEVLVYKEVRLGEEVIPKAGVDGGGDHLSGHPLLRRGRA